MYEVGVEVHLFPHVDTQTLQHHLLKRLFFLLDCFSMLVKNYFINTDVSNKYTCVCAVSYAKVINVCGSISGLYSVLYFCLSLK